tara:strand:+ start:52 stop:630 length:579 start_codon:yes stop_codon:yes gene_type:complete
MFVNNINNDSFIFKPEKSNIIDMNNYNYMMFDLYNFILKKDSEKIDEDLINDDNFYLIINLKLPGYIVRMVFKKNNIKNNLWNSFINNENKEKLFYIQTDYINYNIIPSMFLKPLCISNKISTSFILKNNYLKIDIDLNSSFIARNLFSLVYKLSSRIISDMCFFIKNNDNLIPITIIRFNKFIFEGEYLKN